MPQTNLNRLAGGLQGLLLRSALIFGAMALITAAHYVVPTNLFLSHELLERLYYLPIVFGAVSFGWIGGLLSALCACLCYIPFIWHTWINSPQTVASNYAELVVFVAVGLVTGILADMASRRTHDLQQTTDDLRAAHAELQSKVDQLRQADRLSAVGQLAASLAHEIRNPLGSIEGAVDICERTNDSAKRSEFLGIIKKEVGRLNGLLTNLLDFARPRTPKMGLVQVESLVAPVRNLVSHGAQQRGIQVSIDVPPEFPLVECDAQQLNQAILNVTLNALQASSSGGIVSITAGLERGDVYIRVRDQGRGVSDADCEKLFDPFYTTKDGGTGLGLPISQQILHQHHGSITAQRNSPNGMTFVLRWPMRQNPS